MIVIDETILYLLIAFASITTILLIRTRQKYIRQIDELERNLKLRTEETTAKEKLRTEETTAKEKLRTEETTAKELSNKLDSAARDEFSAMITHELNTP